MKKLLTLLLCCTLILSLAACSSQGEEEAPGVSLLSQEKGAIAQIVIYYDEAGKSPLALDAQEGAALIEVLAAAEGEELPISEEGAQWGNFKYALDIEYQDGRLDQLFSDEEGLVFFRFINEDTAEIRGDGAAIQEVLEAL